MDKLSKMLISINSQEYANYLDILETNVPSIDNNIKNVNGYATMTVSQSTGYKILKFPKYGRVQDTMEELKSKRNTMFMEYRFLRNKLCYMDPKAVDISSIEARYDTIVKQLEDVDQDIQILEMYLVAITNDIQMALMASQTEKRALEHGLSKSYADDNLKLYLSNLKTIHEKDQEILSLDKKHIDFFLKSMFSLTDKPISQDTEPTEKPKPKPKPRAKANKKTKAQTGGSKLYLLDDEKIKKMVKNQLEKIQEKE